MKKVLIFIRIYWIKILFFTIAACLLGLLIFFMTTAFHNFMGLESFNRQQIMAYMGFFLVVGIFASIVQVPLFIGMQHFIMQGGLETMKFDMAKVNVKWNEVIGMEEAKKEAWELVQLLKDRKLLNQVGGKIIKGTMMMGPPGCGKTYLAKAIATECGLPLLGCVGSDFTGMFVGQGTARMKKIFKQARALASLHGGCIIFIDEIDSFARPRGADMGFGGGRMDMNATINQFLTEMDGLRNAENNLVVIAATNVMEHELDSAIMRAGRFDRKIYVSRPNLKEREQILRLYLSKTKYDQSVNIPLLARKTVWFTPADLSNMVREASIFALRGSRDTIQRQDLNDAYERVYFGQKSNIVMTDREKYETAYHEAGHAFIAYLIHPTDDVLKASIIPRRGSLGYVFYRSREELHSKNKEKLLAEIKISVASYVAEKKKFGTTTTGVGGGHNSDFAQAMNTAYDMVHSYGMGRSGLIGDFTNLYDSSLSEKTKEKLNEDTQAILQECLADVSGIMDKHWDAVTEFAEGLYKKGEFDYDEIVPIFDKFGIKPLTRAVLVNDLSSDETTDTPSTPSS